MNVSGLSGEKFASVSSGNLHVCAITTKGVAYCWGSGANGRLGNSGTADSLVPVAVTATGVLSGKTVLSISPGTGGTCAVASDTKAYCWGLNTGGQLGDNSTTQRTAPVAVNTAGVLSGKNIVSVTTSNIHSCAVDSAGLAYCWGTNTNGQLGNDSTSQSLVPVAVDTTGVLSGKTLVMVSSLYHYTCGHASGGTVHCWGLNTWGNLGNGTNYTSLIPTEAMEEHSMQTLAVGASGSHACGVTPIGIAKCWGLSTSGQMGNGYSTQSLYPMALDYRGVLSNKTIKSIATGGAHTCAIASDNNGYCWGAGTTGPGQLGNNGSSNSLVPVAVDTSGVLSGKSLVSISAGEAHTCAIASDQKGYCWGAGTSGQLGNNGGSSSLVPVAVDTSGVLSGKSLVSISAGGGQHTCAVATDGKVYCWGENGNGQLGNNSTNDSQVPVAVTATGALSSKTIVSVSAGASHTCALSSDGYTYCWGLNSSGQLGDNSTTQRQVPVAVYTDGQLSGLTQISISSGANHSCVMASNNNGYCWGSNSSYQLGNNSSTNSSVPVAFSATATLGGEAIKAVYTTGAASTCALTVMGKGYCWGSNSNGQYGANSSTNPIMYPTNRLALNYGEVFGTNIVTGNNTFKLQYAQRTASSCSLQSTGFADVTNTSEIAYSDNANVSNGSAITTNDSDPLAQSEESPQTFVDAEGTFTNATAIEPGKTGLWDFSLKDNAPSKPNTPFCLKITYGDGTDIEFVNSYPEIRTGVATFSVEFVDSTGTAISSPAFNMNEGFYNSSGIQTTTGVFADNNKRLRVWNGSQSAIGWTVSMAATNGPTAYWDRTTDSLTSYDFNDGVNGADGGDADSIGGRLTISGTNAVITPVGSCTSTGVSAGSGGSFVEGTTDSITLLSGSTSADPGCSWDFTNAELSQIIPAGQPVGEYRIWMTVTIVSQ